MSCTESTPAEGSYRFSAFTSTSQSGMLVKDRRIHEEDSPLLHSPHLQRAIDMIRKLRAEGPWMNSPLRYSVSLGHNMTCLFESCTNLRGRFVHARHVAWESTCSAIFWVIWAINSAAAWLSGLADTWSPEQNFSPNILDKVSTNLIIPQSWSIISTWLHGLLQSIGLGSNPEKYMLFPINSLTPRDGVQST